MSHHQLSRALIEGALGYHGKPLQKIWETERQDELQQLGIQSDPDFSVYMARQKHLSFCERAKRLKLHQFMAKNAQTLFDRSLIANDAKFPRDFNECDYFEIPPMETFMGVEAIDKLDHLLETVRPGDVVYGSVVFQNFGGIVLKPLLIVGNVRYYVRNKTLKATIAKNLVVPARQTKGIATGYNVNDFVCCEVLDVSPDVRRLVCTMIRSPQSRAPESITYGLLLAEELPAIYKLATNTKPGTYQLLLEKSPSFRDPRLAEQLVKQVGLDSNEFYTNMSSLKGRYPSQEYASELRNVQASKWAFRSVAEGIEHFKEGRHSEAFQCLNKALSIDPRNVEGLVARGALYANSGSFKKAVEDFEAALKLNPSHANARKYMGETLVALGRSYEDENRFEEAKKAYQDCLNIIPHHEEAQTSLDFLKSKPLYGKQIVEPTELELPALNIVKPSSSDRNKQEPDTSGGSGIGLGGTGGVGGGVGGGGSSSKRDNSESARKERKKESKKDRKKRHKKHQSSSSDSSSDSSDSSDSSSDSSSSTSDSSSSSDSSGSRNKKRKRSKSEKKMKSLSPFSKRMSAAMAGGRGTGVSGVVAGELVGYPLGHGSGSGVVAGGLFGQSSSSHGQSGFDDYEQKVRKFLEMPRDEENYEEKVRRFVAEATKYQKERKQLEDKSKKKKKKEEKKAKKESKKKRKSDEKKKSKKKDKGGGGGGDDDSTIDKDKLREALKIFENFPVLDELGSKLGEYYAKQSAAAGAGGSSAAEILSALLGGTAGAGAGGSGTSGATGNSRAKERDAFRNSKFKVCLSSGLVTETASSGSGMVSAGKSSSDLMDHGPSAGVSGDDNAKDGKWRMMFNKDKRPAPKDSAGSAAGSSAALAQKQHAFGNESDEETAGAAWSGSGGKAQHYSDQRGSRFGTSRYDDRGRDASMEKGKGSAAATAPTVKSGPVVLDKFGNFRLASAETPSNKPPEPAAAPPVRRSRSKSRHRTYGSSRSRSRSRSERRGRSRSGSFRRRFSRSRSRSFSRSRSGSYSRSRSRSRSFERRRFDRRFYRGGRGGMGGGGGYGGDRMGSFGGNRFNNSRGHYRRGGFRDFRDNRFVGRGGGGGGGGGRDRPPFRPRYRGRFQRSYSRSTSKSPDRRPVGSPGDDRPRYRDSRRGESRGARDRGDSRDRSPPPVRRGTSRDSRDNQRDDESRDRHRRSEDRESSKRSKDDSSVSGGGGGGRDGAGTVDGDTSKNDDGSPRAAKSRRRRSKSASGSRSPQSTASSGKNVLNDIEGRWADREERANDKRSEREDDDDGPAPPPRRRSGEGNADDRRTGDKGSAGTGTDASHSAATEDGADDATMEELEKLLTKARKERKEEMMERNKDLLKKTTY
ncbi:tetratricopeptide repeat protein 14 homolog [Anopheles bellator]|uniref:tetratricopeptide repeat protein 14 homolog n=1 Tax=Anopheles bellator TaxID=139047 RepID=UPI0026475F1D|nr:tetratricopeptide repeat protein 14 homolog [Anopheles bellator]